MSEKHAFARARVTFFFSHSVGLGQTRKSRRRYVEKSSETLAGCAFLVPAVTAEQDEEDSIT